MMEQSEPESINGPNGLRQPSGFFYRPQGERKGYVQARQGDTTRFMDEALSMTNSSDSESESEDEGSKKQ
jgi:hypothetical protein